MSSKFFRITDDHMYAGRWFLRGPVHSDGSESDPRAFIRGLPVPTLADIEIAMRQPGQPMDFTLADFDMPVVTRALGAAIDKFAPGVAQRIPVRVAGSVGEFDILNVTRVVRCLDEKRSSIQYWTAQDGRPEKVGQYRTIVDLSVDADCASGETLFRLEGWTIALIASDSLRVKLEQEGFTGFAFTEL